VDFRGDEDEVSPPLKWAGAPKGTESYVLLADLAAEDGGDKTTQWIIYDIPHSVDELREEISGGGSSDVGRLGFKEDTGQQPVVVDPMEQMMNGMGYGGYEDPEMAHMRSMISNVVDSSFDPDMRAKEGANSFGTMEYKGPMNGGQVTFRLYALKGRLSLPPGARREEVQAAMKGKVLGKATLNAKVS